MATPIDFTKRYGMSQAYLDNVTKQTGITQDQLSQLVRSNPNLLTQNNTRFDVSGLWTAAQMAFPKAQQSATTTPAASPASQSYLGN
jgi:hypothetical protein